MKHQGTKEIETTQAFLSKLYEVKDIRLAMEDLNELPQKIYELWNNM